MKAVSAASHGIHGSDPGHSITALELPDATALNKPATDLQEFTDRFRSDKDRPIPRPSRLSTLLTRATTLISKPAQRYRTCYNLVMCPDLAIILPTYNERDNIVRVIERVTSVACGMSWELIVVDDDSPDGTAALIEEVMGRIPHIRLITRINRRGLSSACIEGMLSTTADILVVLDADLQHDEALLPLMYSEMNQRDLDIVIATRRAGGGSMGQLNANRMSLSSCGAVLSRLACNYDLSDPMSGFFMVKRSFFLTCVREMQGGGFKVLLDLMVASPRRPRVYEVPYTFRTRMHGKSKLDTRALLEFVAFILSRCTKGTISSRFILFSIVGSAGVAAHLLVLAFIRSSSHISFQWAQAIATFVALNENYLLNNVCTFRDRRLRGKQFLYGLLLFWLTCSFGAYVNILFARALNQAGLHWWIAGIAGITVSTVWNYAMSTLFTWRN